jgi:acylphosphatase
MGLSRLRLKIHGRVQGVFYRQSTLTQARTLGLFGWVANEEDGSVSIDAQGPKERLESLLIWCWKGPPNARVDHIDASWIEELDESYTRFEVLR